MANNQSMLKDLANTVGSFYERNRRWAPVEPDSFGLELEMEGLNGIGLSDFMDQFGNTTGWSIHEDGSLRNGIEFVSSGPRQFVDLEPDLVRLNRKLDRRDLFKPDFSIRTSVHVHMNARHLTWLQVINLFVLYTIYEQALIDFGGEERNGNVHCLSVLDSQSNIEILRRALIADIEPETDQIRNYGRNSFRQIIQQLTDRGRRYAALNFAALPTHGTLEFRTHRGTRDTAEIMEWVTILRKLRDVASAYENPQDIIRDFSTEGYLGFAAGVWAEHPRLLAIVEQQRRQCWTGMRLAQEIAFSRSNWQIAEKKSKKVPMDWGYITTTEPPLGWDQPLQPNPEDDFRRRQQLFMEAIVREQRRVNRNNVN